MESTYRNSLSHEQNVAIEMAARIQQKYTVQKADGGEKKSEKEGMRSRIRTVAKMQRLFKTRRQQNESVLKNGGVDQKVYPGMLLEQEQSQSDMFAKIRQADMANERMLTKPKGGAKPNGDAKPWLFIRPSGTSEGSFLAASTPIFPSKFSLD